MDSEENVQSVEQTLPCRKSEKLRFKNVRDFLLNEKIAEYFLELASVQRLNILRYLEKNPSKVSILAKELDATPPEVHRNFVRLEKNGFITRNSDGLYLLTSFGRTSLMLIPPMTFVSGNLKFFREHSFDGLDAKFVQRIGVLENSSLIKGFVRVQEKWESIYENASKYIYNILFEVPYNSEIVKTVLKKTNSGTKIKSIFSESVIFPQERKEVMKKSSFEKFIKEGTIQRRVNVGVKVMVVLNENEACVAFPKTDGEIDVSQVFYSTDAKFHEWCLDYFNYVWENSGQFREIG